LRFNEEFIENVREANNIVDLIGQFVQLQKAGSSFRGLCPFPSHAEKTPSFYVSDVKQLYHCFGCKKSGSAYNFLMDFQGMSFPDAVEYLANRANIALPVQEKITPAQAAVTDERHQQLKVNKYVAVYFYNKLKALSSDQGAQKYLHDRGLTPEIVEEFKLGYASTGWSDLAGALLRARAPLQSAEKLGLIKKKQSGDYFDLFRDRLMFPILSPNGNVLGFGGRSLGDQMPKYINSSDSPVFNKGKTLYGLHVTAKHIRAQNEVYIVEGYMDLLALYQFGVKNVVATLGTAFTLEHAKSLKKLCSRVVVLFDGDDAGQLAADKSLPMLLDAGVFSRCLSLPGQKDPDDYLREFGLEEFQRLAAQAPDHFISFMNRHMAHFKGQPSEKVELLDVLGPLLERVTDQRLRILYLQEVAERLGMEQRLVAQQLRAQHAQPAENTQINVNTEKTEKIPTEEEILVQFMLQKPVHLEFIQASGAIEKFVNNEARMVAQKVVEKYCQNPNDFDKLGASLKGEGVNSELLTNHIGFNSGLDKAGDEQLIQDCLVRVKDRYLKRMSKNLLNSIKSEPDLNNEQLEIFMKIAMEQKGPQQP